MKKTIKEHNNYCSNLIDIFDMVDLNDLDVLYDLHYLVTEKMSSSKMKDSLLIKIRQYQFKLENKKINIKSEVK